MVAIYDRTCKTNWYVTVPLLSVLLLWFAGLYAVSGMPLPWSSPTAKVRENASYQRFRVLASVIASVGEDVTAGQRKEALEKVGVQFDGRVGSYVGEQLEVGEWVGPLGIVVIGQLEDENGMRWAITRKGRLIKISAGTE